MDLAVRHLHASAFTIPTDTPEADGTYAWDRTTIVVVELDAGDPGGPRHLAGLGYTYGDASLVRLICEKLAAQIEGCDAMSPEAAYERMARATRNDGRPGLCSMAISAVDAALWDLKARALGLPLCDLLGRVRDSIAAYGSGGFTSYAPGQLQAQLSGWAAAGIRDVKMKVGARPEEDPDRVAQARAALGPDVGLYVDANGAYSQKQALRLAEAFARCGVSWFEEPVSSDDLDGLRRVRERAPAGMDIAAGEYGYTPWYFRRMLQAGAVDVLQADGTRCGGVTGLLRAGALCDAFHLALSAHTAPSLHAHPLCAIARGRNVEYFHDHVRVESMLFDGAQRARDGRLWPDRSRPGLGLELRRADARRFAA